MQVSAAVEFLNRMSPLRHVAPVRKSQVQHAICDALSAILRPNVLSDTPRHPPHPPFCHGHFPAPVLPTPGQTRTLQDAEGCNPPIQQVLHVCTCIAMFSKGDCVFKGG
jgi:hypothetical protein